MDLNDDDHRGLTELSYRYAAHADDRDFDALGELFTDDAVLVSGAGTRDGRAAILEAMRGLERYGRTFHLVGQVRLWVEGDGPHGETYCTAHHFTTSTEGAGDDHRVTDRILSIRYHDTYVHHSGAHHSGAHDSGGWRFARRVLDIVATQTITAPGSTLPPS